MASKAKTIGSTDCTEPGTAGEERDRGAAIDEIFTEDAVFYDPNKGVYRGRDEVDRIDGRDQGYPP